MRGQLTVSVAWLNQQQGLDLICSFGLLGMLSVATGPCPTPSSQQILRATWLGLTSAVKKVENEAGALQVESELGG